MWDRTVASEFSNVSRPTKLAVTYYALEPVFLLNGGVEAFHDFSYRCFISGTFARVYPQIHFLWTTGRSNVLDAAHFHFSALDHFHGTFVSA